SRFASAFPDRLEVGAEILAELRMPQRILDGGAQIADLAAAVVPGAMERPDVHRLVREQRGDAVGQLNLAARASTGALELVEDGGCQHVTADDGEVRRRLFRPRLLDDLLD